MGEYNYPAPGQPRPHGVTSISGAVNTTFTYDAKGNMTSGNGLGITYASFNKPTAITRGTATVSFEHDPEHQRYIRLGQAGITHYVSGTGILVERFAGTGGVVRWTNYLIAGGRLIAAHIENSDGTTQTTQTRYFHHDHLGSIALITKEEGLGELIVAERLSYDPWGQRRQADGMSGSVVSEESHGFTGHEHLDEVGLIHMNGRVYDPMLGRFGTPDPMTESPFSTQGWNRYTYVGNSPLNFTDPTGYCFMGCFWKPLFKAIGNFFKQSWGAILQVAATALCWGNPVCGAIVGGFTSAWVAGVNGGSLSQMLRAGLSSAFTAVAMWGVGELTGGFNGVLDAKLGGHGPLAFGSEAHLFNMAGHALVGCASAVIGGGKCGPGALSGTAGSFAGPILKDLGFQKNLIAHAVVGGLASVAGGGKFANGAVTAAFGYLFNRFGSRDEAARAALDLVNPLTTVYEWGGLIYRLPDGTCPSSGCYDFTPPVPGDLYHVQPFDAYSMVPQGATIDGAYHTHPAHADWDKFSPEDRDFANDVSVRMSKESPYISSNFGFYLGTPDGNYRLYQPTDPRTWRGDFSIK